MLKPGHEGGPEEAQTPLISFPWLFHRELARVALGRGGDVRPLQTSDGDRAVDDGEIGILGDTVSPDAIDLESWKKGGNANERGDSVGDGETDEDYVRTSGGQVVYRGQILTLFKETGELVNAQQDTTAQILPTARSISNHSLVPDNSTGSSAPASPRSEHRSEEDYEYFEFEEVGDAGHEEEDALEVLARKIGV